VVASAAQAAGMRGAIERLACRDSGPRLGNGNVSPAWLISTITGHWGVIRAVTIAPDGTWLATASGKTLWIRDTE